MKEQTQLSISEYCKHFPDSAIESNRDLFSRKGGGVKRQAILYRINNGKELPYVSSYKLVGGIYILTMKKEFNNILSSK